MDKNTERMFEMKRKILSYILLMVMVLTLVGCGAESSNENQKDNIQGTTNSENAGSSSEQVQGSTDAPTTTPEPTEAPVTELIQHWKLERKSLHQALVINTKRQIINIHMDLKEAIRK